MESPPRRGDLIGIKITQDLLSEGSEIQIGVMPSNSLSTFRQEADVSRVWERNLKESDGAHVLIVSEGVTNLEEPDPDRPGLGRPGHVYGLFECVLRGGIA